MTVPLDELDALIAKYMAAESPRTRRNADAAHDVIMANRVTGSDDEDEPATTAQCEPCEHSPGISG